jgi:hypothetical protein
MPWQLRLPFLMNKPVGVSLANGQGVSGILCSSANGQIYLLEYLYASQFATKHYAFNEIQDILPFPGCYTTGMLY